MRYTETNTKSHPAHLRSVARWVLASTLVSVAMCPALAQEDSVVQLSSGSYAAFEDQTELTVTVVRWGGTQGFSVDYETSDGTARAGADYLARSGTLSFGEGEATKTIAVPILDDDLTEGSETVKLSLRNPSGQVTLGQPTLGQPSEAILWIADDEPGATLWDPTFAPRLTYLFVEGQGYSGGVGAIALQPDGKILISGNFERVNGVARARVARLNADGSLDTSFDVGLGPVWPNHCSYGLHYALAVSDGALFVGGNFTSFNGAARTGIAKLDATGALDVNFRPELYASGCGVHVSAVAVQSDGKVLIGGVLSNGIRRFGIARLHADGTLDTTFNPPFENYSAVKALALQKDGHVVVSGDLNYGDGDRHLVRLTANGSVDVSFDPKFAGFGHRGGIDSIALDQEGKVLVGGSFVRVDGVSRSGIVRLNQDGSVDATFDPGTGVTDEIGAPGSVAFIVVQPDGKILLNGNFRYFNGLRRAGIARLRADGSLETSFRPDACSEFIFAAGAPMVLAQDGKVLIWAWQSWNGLGSNGIFRLNSGLTIRSMAFTATDVPAGESGGSATATVERIGDPSGTITVDYVTLPGSATPGVDYVEQSGTLTFGPGEASQAITIRILDDAIAEGRETILLTLRDPSPGALLASEQTTVLTIHDDDSPGNVDLRFNPSAGTTVGGAEIAGAVAFLPLVVQPNGKAWIGGSYDVFVRDRFGGRLNQDGSLDLTATVSPELFPDFSYLLFFQQALGVQSDGGAIVWGFRPDLVEFGYPTGLSKVNLDGSPDPTFQRFPPEEFLSCCATGAVQPDDRIVVIMGPSSDNPPSLIRLTASGELDASFKPFKMDREVYLRAISFQADGRIILAGARYAITDGRALPELLRLLPNGDVDPGFMPELTPKAGDLNSPFYSSLVGSVLVQTDGRLIVAGRFAIQTDPSHDNLVRLNPNGSLDTSFARAAVPTDEFWTVAALQADGKIMLASYRDSYFATTLTRLNPDGSLDDTFDLGAADGSIERMTFQPDGKLLVAGQFTEINGVKRRNLARLNFPPPFRFGPVGWTETGLVRLSVSTQPGRDYVLEVSTNLTAWAPLFTNTASGSSLVFEDPAGTTFPQRFYRARLR